MRNNHSIKQHHFRLIPTIALLIYLYLLTRIILFKGHPIDPGLIQSQLTLWLQHPEVIHTRTINLTPFQEITRGWNRLSLHPTGTSLQLIGNLFAFVPLGILIPLLLRHRLSSGILVLLCSLLLSLGYEVIQLLTGIGIFDVDDLMLNTFGGVTGYILFAIPALTVKWLLQTKKRNPIIRS